MKTEWVGPWGETQLSEEDKEIRRKRKPSELMVRLEMALQTRERSEFQRLWAKRTLTPLMLWLDTDCVTS